MVIFIPVKLAQKQSNVS